MSGILFTITALGDSQYPIITSGSTLTVSPTGAIRPGDLIVFTLNNVPVCHRVMWTRARGQKEYLLKGDNVSVCDGWIQGTAVKGRVVKINDASTSSFAFLLESIWVLACYWTAQGVDAFVFRSFIGRWGGNVRKRFFSNNPVVYPIVSLCFTPWKLWEKLTSPVRIVAKVFFRR